MAKIDGQLEGACLEQIAAATTLPATRGRIYLDITNPAAAVARLHNGTTWKQLAYFDDIPTNAVVSQNSGKAVTVDWSTGRVQKVVLTDNAVISFSNPVANAQHRLIVVQTPPTSTIGTGYQYKLDMPDQEVTFPNIYQPKGVLDSGSGIVYTWLYQASIRAAYTTIQPVLPVPPGPSTGVTGLAVHAEAKILGYGQTTGNFHNFHQLYGDNQIFGFSQATTVVAAAAKVVGACWLPSGRAYFAVGATSPFVQGWNVDGINQPSGSAYANPSILPAGAGQCIACHPGSGYIAVGHTTTPFMSVYPVFSSGYGAKLTNPSTLPAAQVNSVAFSPLGDYLAIATQTSPFIQVYVFDPVAGTIGAAAANPGVLPSGGPPGGTGHGIAWRPQGDWIALASSVTPFLYVIKFNRATGAFVAASQLTLGAPLATATSVAWSPDGQTLIVGQGGSPYLTMFDFSSLTLGTQYTYDIAGPTVNVNDVVVHPDGKRVFVAHNGTPFISTYPLPNKVRNYLRV